MTTTKEDIMGLIGARTEDASCLTFTYGSTSALLNGAQVTVKKGDWVRLGTTSDSYYEVDKVYGDVGRLHTHAFLKPLEEGEEIELERGSGCGSRSATSGSAMRSRVPSRRREQPQKKGDDR